MNEDQDREQRERERTERIVGNWQHRLIIPPHIRQLMLDVIEAIQNRDLSLPAPMFVSDLGGEDNMAEHAVKIANYLRQCFPPSEKVITYSVDDFLKYCPPGSKIVIHELPEIDGESIERLGMFYPVISGPLIYF